MYVAPVLLAKLLSLMVVIRTLWFFVLVALPVDAAFPATPFPLPFIAAVAMVAAAIVPAATAAPDVANALVLILFLLLLVFVATICKLPLPSSSSLLSSSGTRKLLLPMSTSCLSAV